MMSEKIKNLTTPDEIIHAFLIKDSRHALSKFADQSKFSRAYISQHVHGHRNNKDLLQEIANHLGYGIYGVLPNDSTHDKETPIYDLSDLSDDPCEALLQVADRINTMELKGHSYPDGVEERGGIGWWQSNSFFHMLGKVAHDAKRVARNYATS